MLGKSQKVGTFDSNKEAPSRLRFKKNMVMDVTFLAHLIGKYYLRVLFSVLSLAKNDRNLFFAAKRNKKKSVKHFLQP